MVVGCVRSPSPSAREHNAQTLPVFEIFWRVFEAKQERAIARIDDAGIDTSLGDGRFDPVETSIKSRSPSAVRSSPSVSAIASPSVPFIVVVPDCTRCFVDSY